jgi:ankyrin repeat protein
MWFTFDMRLSWPIWVVSTASLIIASGCQRQPEYNAGKSEKVTVLTAANNGDLSQLRKLLRDGADPNEHTGTGKTALHYAAQSKNVAVVEALIRAGANVNSEMTGNVTPLMLSLDMAFGQPEIALALIRAGANINVADKNGDTALIIAATESSGEVFRILLEKGANPNARDLNGETALHYVAMNAILDRAKLLLDYGADPTIRNQMGKTPYEDAETTNPEKSVQAEFQEMRSLLMEATRKKAETPPSLGKSAVRNNWISPGLHFSGNRVNADRARFS